MTTVATPTRSATVGSPPGIGPVRGRERIVAIDVLRGVAILGILVVNMGLFSLPEGAPVGGVAERLIYFFAQEKFKTLFSFLFGVGLAVQLLRAEMRGVRLLPVYARRLCVLFLIGVAHFVFVWDGDILHDYALLGFVLLLFRHRSPRTLLVWSGALLAIPVFLFGLTTYNSLTHRVSPPLQRWIAYETEPDDQQTAAEHTRIYSRGSYREQVAWRAGELPGDLTPDSDDAFVFAAFLLGLYAGRRRIVYNIPGHLPLIRRVQRWGLVIGVAGNAAFALGGAFDPAPTAVMQNLGRMCLVVAAPALTLCYASTIVLLLQRETWRRWLAPVAAVGRMALSNYLLQSLICTTIFYSFGFGLFGRVPPSLGLLLTVAIFFLQIPLSVWWLSRFQFGPVEWLWRSLTYWHLQPMRAGSRP